MDDIGTYLKELRTSKGLTINDVQKQSGGKISQSYITYIEKGDKTPSVAKLEIFADVYEISIHALIDVMIEHSEKGKLYTTELSKQELKMITNIRKTTNRKKKLLMELISIL